MILRAGRDLVDKMTALSLALALALAQDNDNPSSVLSLALAEFGPPDDAG